MIVNKTSFILCLNVANSFRILLIDILLVATCIIITNLNRKQNNNYGSKTVLIILAAKASDQ